MPRTLALRAVHRQTAASRSTKPWMSEQHGWGDGCPNCTLSRPLSTFAHTPSLRASIGQFPDEPGVLGGVTGVGLGLGTEGVGTEGVGTEGVGTEGLGIEGLGYLGLGTFGLGTVLGLGLRLHRQSVAVVKVKKRMLRAKKRAREVEFFEAIGIFFSVLRIIDWVWRERWKEMKRRCAYL